MSIETADVAVIGLGAVGSAVLYQLARRGVKAIGIDRFSPPHTMGSSHGESRITRLTAGEGHVYAPLVRRSHEIWRELEASTGESLMRTTGGLFIARTNSGARHHGAANFVEASAEIARRFDIPHEMLSPDEVMRRYPQMVLRGDEVTIHEPSAGTLFPETCVRVQLAEARRLGATVRTDEPVLRVTESGGVALIETATGMIEAQQAVITAGPWVAELAGSALADRTRVYRQVLQWYPCDDPAIFAPERFPVFIWMYGEQDSDYLYGFPAFDGQDVKLATEFFETPTTADTVERSVSPAESQAMYDRHVAGRISGLARDASRAQTCLYTVTPDSRFIVDRLPGHDRVAAVSACSGHGFKHSAGLGEAVAEWVLTGASTIDLTPFRLS